MDEKTLNYIKILSNDEIKEQLKDFLLWAREYEQALKKELEERQTNVMSTQIYNANQIGHLDNEDETLLDSRDTFNDSIDYEIATMICEKVSHFDRQKTIDKINELKEKSREKLSLNEMSLIQFEVRECEQHLQEISFKDAISKDNLCSVCGNKLDNGSFFCGKCGNRVC